MLQRQRSPVTYRKKHWQECILNISHTLLQGKDVSPVSQEVSICPLGFIALNPSTKGLPCPFLQEQRRDLTFRTPLCQDDLHFVIAQSLKPSSWCSSPLRSPKAVAFHGEREVEGFSLDELLEKAKDL